MGSIAKFLGRERTELPAVETWRHLGQAREGLGGVGAIICERQCLQKVWPHWRRRGARESSS